MNNSFTSFTAHRWPTLLVLVVAFPGEAQQQGDNCHDQYQKKIRQNNKEFIDKSMSCGGDSSCLEQARSDKATAGQQASQSLFHCRVEVKVSGTDKDYNPDYGKSLPAMKGSVPYGGVTLTVKTAKGRLVGQGFQGPVDLISKPRVYSRAEGFIKSQTEFHITRLWDTANQAVPLSGPISVHMRPK